VPHVEEVNDDFVLMSYAITDRHGRPGGTVSGPVMMTLADTSAWVVIMSQIGPVVLAVTTSLHIDFLRKPELTDIMAKARILKLGKRLAVVDVELFSRDSAELVANPSDLFDTASSLAARSPLGDRAPHGHRYLYGAVDRDRFETSS